jgi:hypothetical protein
MVWTNDVGLICLQFLRQMKQAGGDILGPFRTWWSRPQLAQLVMLT